MLNINTIPLFNQNIWDKYPERATEVALEAISHGGFDEDCIKCRVGNYEGQIMAIQRGWVKEQEYRYLITDKGIQALRDSGKDVPTFLTAVDSWHNSLFSYCVFSRKDHKGRPYVKLMRDVIPAFGSVGMDPILYKADVGALIEYLTKWIEEVA